MSDTSTPPEPRTEPRPELPAETKGKTRVWHYFAVVIIILAMLSWWGARNAEPPPPASPESTQPR